MSNAITVELFAEDRVQAEFLVPLAGRIAWDEGFDIRCRARCALGARTRVLREFRSYQRLWERGILTDIPDVLIVAINTHRSTPAATRAEIEETTHPELRDILVTAYPDPHIERWLLADPVCVHVTVGPRPDLRPVRSERDYYRAKLREAVRRGGHPATLGGAEFIRDIVQGMDEHEAGKDDRALKAFMDQLRARIRAIKATHEADGS